MGKRWYLTLCLLGMCLQGFGQTGTVGRVEIGASFLDLGQLQSAMEQANFGSPQENLAAFGFSVSHYHERIVLGGELYNFMSSKTYSTDLNLSLLRYNWLMGEFGYVIIGKGDPLRIYPTIGVGYGWASLLNRELTESEGIKHRANGLVLDGAIHATMTNEIADDPGKKIEWGIVLGYMYSAENMWNFSLNESTMVQGGPGGPYLRLTMGLGFW
ncbi:hypothetical protein [Pontibacter sp. G13]|uniref:hypothetical protein n=1 Tax=Pontibacter sp. G13 TaxID=3074898 RepID=UPI002889CD2B|nr:hypothetical protein [Pontibacter sp. G13]WNJ16033.1 hypothetical protein RJD25_14315 [Pontibacter sp. G13]